MSEIPEDVMREAAHIIRDLIGWGQQVDDAFAPSTIRQDATVIARALMAERERCARIAETANVTHFLTQSAIEQAKINREEIATAIRNQDKGQG